MTWRFLIWKRNALFHCTFGQVWYDFVTESIVKLDWSAGKFSTGRKNDSEDDDSDGVTFENRLKISKQTKQLKQTEVNRRTIFQELRTTREAIGMISAQDWRHIFGKLIQMPQSLARIPYSVLFAHIAIWAGGKTSPTFFATYFIVVVRKAAQLHTRTRGCSR